MTVARGYDESGNKDMNLNSLKAKLMQMMQGATGTTRSTSCS